MGIYTKAVQELYVAYFSRPADAAGLAYWESVVAAQGGSTTAVSAAFSTSAEYTAAFAGMNSTQVVNQVYMNLFGRAAEPSGLLYWALLLDQKAITVSNVVTQIAAGAQTTDLVAYNSKVTAATSFTTALDTTAEINGYSGAPSLTLAKAFIAGVTDATTLAAAIVPATLNATVAAVTSAVAGLTFSTTAGVDNIVGTAGDDIITATDTSYTGLDQYNGAAGNDLLVINDVAGAAVVLSKATVSNVESLVLNSTTGLVGNAASTTAFSGLTSATFKLNAAAAATTITAGTATAVTVVNPAAAIDLTINGGGGAIKVTNGTGNVTIGATGANAITSATVKGGAVIAVDDKSGASAATGTTLKTVSLDGNTGTATLTGKGLTSVSLSNTTGAALTIANSTAHTETVTLNKVVGGVVTDANATTFNIATAGTKASHVDLAIGSATVLNASGAAALTLDTAADDYSSLVTVNVANTGAFSADLTGASASLTSVNAATSTGANTVALNAGVAYVGGTGVDTVILAAAPTSSIDGGAGTDVFALTGLADLTTVTATSMAKAVNFETLGLAGVFGSTAPNATLTVSNLPAGMTNVAFLAGSSAGAAVTVKNGAANTGLTFLAGIGQTVTYTQKTDTTNDSLTVTLGDATTTGVSNTLVADKIEHLTIDTHATSSTINNALTGSFAAATTLKVTGEAGLNINGATVTKLATIDAAGHNAWLRATTTLVTGVTITHGDGGTQLLTAADATHGDIITVGLAGDNSNYITVGAGNNTITTAGSAVGGRGNYIYAGNGDNTIKVGANNATNSSSYVSVGNGDNIITLGDGGALSTGLDVSAGTGNNTITLGNNAGTDSSYVSVGDGDNTIVIGNYTGTDSNGNYVSAGNGDNTITAGTLNATATNAQINVGTGSNTIVVGDGTYAVYATTGGTGDNSITTAAGNNVIVGGDGVDTISAGAGDDAITGNVGADILTGGAGIDTFYYVNATDSQGTSVDTITDFTHLSDKISLDVLLTGTFLGTANGYGAVLTALVADGNGHAVFDSSTKTLYVDMDGNGILNTSDLAINLTGVTTLTAADFLFV